MRHSHLRCTESFYRSSIMEELQTMPSAGQEDRQKMMRILHRFENEDTALTHSPEQPDSNTEARKTALTPRERQEILTKTHRELSGESALRRLREPESSKTTSAGRTSVDSRGSMIKGMHEMMEEGDHDEEEDEDVDEDEDEKAYRDFVSRVANVDLETESFESLWARLSPAEQKGFRDMIGTSDLAAQPRYPEGATPAVVDEDEEAILKLMQATGLELQESLMADDPLMADLDADDLRALRETEIAALVPVWRPWWEVEAEEQGQLYRVDGVEASAKGAIIDDQEKALKEAAEDQVQSDERLVLDEKALLRPYARPLVQELTQGTEGTSSSPVTPSSASVPIMTNPPHPSLVYHLVSLVFAYAATSRALNGDLTEFPEETLAHLLDLCPFLAPLSNSTNGTPPVEMGDFTTALAIIQQASLASKDRWKGDTLRLELLSLLLQDLTLLLASPQRCAAVLQETRQVLDRISTTMSMATATATAAGAKNQSTPEKKKGPFSKTFVFRVSKKLDFYESFIRSPWFLGTATDQQQSALLDVVRVEVLVEGGRVRQELQGWERDLEASKKLRRELKDKKESDDLPTTSTVVKNKPLIEVL
ncbi:hypothetical protein DFQ26_008721 [Actinomortierella ambigua]|nr:hypothetical protein DFQ26_008721 [Actinomortierella ambigua]